MSKRAYEKRKQIIKLSRTNKKQINTFDCGFFVFFKLIRNLFSFLFGKTVFYIAALATILGGIAAYLALWPQIIVTPPKEVYKPFYSTYSVLNNSVFGIEDVSVYFNYDILYSNYSVIKNANTDNFYRLGNIERGEELNFRMPEPFKVEAMPIKGSICILIDYNYFLFSLFLEPEFRGFIFDEISQGFIEKSTDSCTPEAKKNLLSLRMNINQKIQ